MASVTGDIKQCLLRSRNYKLRDVVLPNQFPLLVGRGALTKIRDRKCSKNQVEITADYSKGKATVLQCGGNPSEVNGKILVVGEKLEVESGSSINLLEDDLKYTLEFLSTASPTRHKHQLKVSPNPTPKKQKIAKPNVNEVQPVVNESVESYNNTAAESIEAKAQQEPCSSKDSAPRSECLQKTVMNAFQNLSTKDRWEEYDHSKILIFTPAGLVPQKMVAAFDLDHTIICTQSGKVFPTNIHDWKIFYADIPGKLKKLHNEGYKIVIFTNQKGISRGRTSSSDFKTKIERIVSKLGIPIQVMVSTGSGKYRKPNTGMWEYFTQKCNCGIEVDVESSMYIGDAAGRLENWAPKKKKDFSCADRLFALNVGLKFFTPEEFFLGQKPASYKMPLFDPRNLKQTTLAVKVLPLPREELNSDLILSSSVEIIVFVGFPAAGKSHFAETYLVPKGYSHINRDKLGSWQKCVSECSQSISRGKSVVIDNTNPDPESRGRYIEVAKKFNVPCRCFLFACSLEQAKHNNVYRELKAPDEKHVSVNDMVINSYKSKYKEPRLEEGFTSLITVNFVPKFRSKHEEKLFKKFLIEK